MESGPGQRQGWAQRLVQALACGLLGAGGLALVALVLRAPPGDGRLPEMVACKLFFLLTIGSVSLAALAHAVEAVRPAPPPAAPRALEALCAACGCLGDPASGCRRCGWRQPASTWAPPPRPGMGNLVLTGFFGGVASLGVLLLLLSARGAARSPGGTVVFGLLGLFLTAVGALCTLTFVAQARDCRRQRGHHHAAFAWAPGCAVGHVSAEARLDPRGQLVRARGESSWPVEPPEPRPLGGLSPALAQALRLVARLERRDHASVSARRTLRWGRLAPPLAPAPADDYRRGSAPAHDAWTCDEQVSILLRVSATDPHEDEYSSVVVDTLADALLVEVPPRAEMPPAEMLLADAVARLADDPAKRARIEALLAASDDPAADPEGLDEEAGRLAGWLAS